MSAQPQTNQQGGGVDAEALADALASRLGNQQASQLSDEQLAKALNRWDPDDTFVEALFGENTSPEARLKAFHSLVRNIVKESVTTAGHMARYETQQLQEQLNPWIGVVHEVHKDRTFDQFFKKYPGLSSHKEIVELVGKTIQPNGKTNRDEIFELVAGEATKMVQKSHPEFVLEGSESNAGAEQKGGAASGSTGMASMSVGSSGGAASTPAKSTTGKISDIWD